MDDKDFIYLNVPALLERKAWTSSTEGGLVEDESWANRLEGRLATLVRFFCDYGLLEVQPDENISSLVLLYSDFNDQGKRFIMSGAPDRWLSSFDRNPNKLSSDTSYLVKALSKLLAQ